MIIQTSRAIMVFCIPGLLDSRQQESKVNSRTGIVASCPPHTACHRQTTITQAQATILSTTTLKIIEGTFLPITLLTTATILTVTAETFLPTTVTKDTHLAMMAILPQMVMLPLGRLMKPPADRAIPIVNTLDLPTSLANRSQESLTRRACLLPTQGRNPKGYLA